MNDKLFVCVKYGKCSCFHRLVRRDTSVSDPDPGGCDCDVCLGPNVKWIEIDDYCPLCIYKGFNK